MNRQQYSEYLRTPEWRRTREKVIKREKGLCQYCGAPGQDVHHTPEAYKYVQSEDNYLDADGDLEAKFAILLCRSCHIAEHLPPRDPPTFEVE